MNANSLRAPAGALALAALALLSVSAGAQETYSTWSKHRDVFLNTTNTTGGANVTADVTNFPVLIRLTARDSVFAQALAGGADLRFTKANDVVRLKHQIDTWDTATKTASVWVLVDTVYGNNKTQKIRMHWGKAGAADSSQRGAGLHHRQRLLQRLAPGQRPGTRGPALGGRGRRLRHSLQLPHHLRSRGRRDRQGRHLARRHPPRRFRSPHPRLGHGLQFVGHGLHLLGVGQAGRRAEPRALLLLLQRVRRGGERRDHDGAPASTDLFKFRTRTGAGSYSGPNTAGDIALGEWQHFVFTRPGNTGTARIYKNGMELIADESMAAFADTARPNNYLGGSFSPNDNNYSGLLDEARLSKTARSADWIKLEYENQKPRGGLAFFDSAAPTPPPAPTLAYAPDTLRMNAGTFQAAVIPVVSGFIDSITVSPALPAGLTFNKTTGQISGTPAATSSTVPTTHVFTAMNTGGSAKDTIVMVVGPPAAIFGRDDLHAGFSIRSTPAGVVFRLPEGASRGLLTVSDLHGRAVWSREMGAEGSATMSRGDLPMGVYTAKLTLLQGTGAGNSLRKSFTLVR